MSIISDYMLITCTLLSEYDDGWFNFKSNLSAYHAVVHDFVPIFASYDAEEKCDSIGSGLEVSMPEEKKTRKLLIIKSE